MFNLSSETCPVSGSPTISEGVLSGVGSCCPLDTKHCLGAVTALSQFSFWVRPTSASWAQVTVQINSCIGV